MKRIYTQLLRVFLVTTLLSVASISQAADYYWVGGAGSWTDLSHWATTSGGGTFHIIVPTPLDNVIFDANSFSANGQTVTISFESFCNTMVASNLGFQVILDFNSTFNSKNGIDLESDIIWQQSGNLKIDAGGLVLGNGLNFSLNSGSSNIYGGFLMETSSTAVHSGTLSVHSGGLTLESGATLTTNANNITGGLTLDSGAILTATGNNNITGDIVINDGGSFTQNGTLTLNGDFNMVGNSVYLQNYGEYRISNGDINMDNGSNFWSKGGYWGYIYQGNLNMVSGSIFRDDAYYQFYVGDLVIPSGADFYGGGGQHWLRGGGFKAEAGSTITLGSGQMYIYDGGFELDPGATISGYSKQLYFRTNSFGQYNIQSSGINLRRIQLDGSNHNSEYTLVDDLTATGDGLFMYANKFISNGKALNLARFYSWTGGANVMDLTGTPIVNVTTEFRIHPSTNTILIWDTPNITFTTGSNISFYAGINNTFDDIIMNATSTGATNVHLQYVATIENLTINASGTQNVNWYDGMTVDDFTLNYSVNTTTNPSVYLASGNKTFNNTFTINSSGTLDVAFKTYGNNTFNVLDVGNRMDSWLIQSGTTQTISDLKDIIGTCEEPILITSSSLGSQGNIEQLTGTVTGDYLQLQDNNVFGGATFTTTNTADLGNVTGWTIVPIAPETFYWIGENGIWNDPDNWSLSSGGPAYCAVPSRIDDVVFDSNSFSGSGQFCNVDLPAECHDMTWVGIEPGAGFSGNQKLDIYSSLTLDGNMVNNYTGVMYFHAIDNNNTIETQGITIYSLRLDGQGQNTGVWTMVDDLKTSNWFYITRGTFNSDGNNFDLYAFSSSSSTVNFTNGTSLVKVQHRFEANSSTTLDMGIADILFEASNQHMYFRYNNGHDFNNVTMNQNSTGGYQVHFRYNNNSTFKDVTITKYGNAYIYFQENDNNTYEDVILNQHGSAYIIFNYSQNNTYNDVVFNHYKGGHTQIYNTDNQTFQSWKVLHTHTSGSPQFMLYSNSTGNNFGDFEFSTVDPNLQPYFWAERSFIAKDFILNNVDLARFHPSYTYYFDDVQITGDCTDRTLVYSQTSGSAVTFETTNTAHADFTVIKDINATGTATYTSSNSIDGGNVTNWPIGVGTNLYWVGGAGNWNDVNHWSFTSGGPAAGCIPTRGDNVFFDVNSFTGSNQNVNVNITAECRNMVWNNVNSPNITGGSTLNVYGSLQLAPNLTWNHSGWIFFQARDAGHTITTNGVQMRQMQFLSDGTYDGEWTLQDDLDVLYDVYVQNGSFISDGNNLSARSFFSTNNNAGTSVDFAGTDLISLRHRFELTPNINFDIGSADISWSNMEGGYYRIRGRGNTFNDLIFDHDDGANRIYLFDQNHNNVVNNVIIESTNYPRIDFYNNQTYNDITILFDNNSTNIPAVYFHGTNDINVLSVTSTGNGGPYIYLNNNNTMNDLIAAGLGTRLLLGAGKIQTVNGILALGNGSFPVFVKSQTDGSQSTIFVPSGEVCLDFVLLQDVVADANAGGGTFGLATEFFAGASSVDLGNNANWQFTSCEAYYWVGDSGDWSDYSNHWATSSGGTVFHISVPGPTDDVFFDVNSFTTNGRVVNVDIVNANAHNMTWQSAVFDPTLVGNTNMNIYGDLELIPGMNQDFTGAWNFEADDAGNLLNTVAHEISEANFNGGLDGEGEWVLQNALNVSGDINFNNGILNTNDKDISAQNFNSATTNIRSLLLGSSDVTITDGSWNPATLTNATLDEGTSTIIITGDNTSSFLGNSLDYNDVTFATSNTLDASLTGTNSFNNLQIDQGLTLTAETTTQTMNQLIANGSCDELIIIKSDNPGTSAIFSQATGSTNTSFLDLTDNTGTGGATFNADFSIDNGGNTGWFFTAVPDLVVTIVTGDVDCETNNDGFAEVTNVTGGTAPYTYLWSTTESTALIENLIPGAYTVTVTDASDCAVTVAVAVINEPSNITPTPFTASDLDICIGTEIDFTAGTPPEPVDSYLWDFGDFTSSTDQNPSHTYTAGGTYTVSLSYVDEFGCPSIVTETVQVSDLQTVLTVVSVDCFGNDNGSIDIDASGGVEPYQYSIDNGTNYFPSGSFTSLTPGSYDVIVLDDIGCFTATQTVNITEPSSNVGFTYVVVNASCADVEDGTITITASGGTAPYDYSINNGILFQTSNTFSDLAIGTYNIVVRDDNNCAAPAQMATIVVEDTEVPTITCPANAIEMAAPGECDADVTVFSPSTDDNCAVATIVNDYNNSDDASGNYPLGVTTVIWTVTDVNANTATCSMTVTVTDNEAPTASCMDITVDLDSNGDVSIVAADVDDGSSDICGDITLSVSQSDFDCGDVGDNLVTLTVTDANGNTATCSATVTVEDNENPTITCPTDVDQTVDGGVCNAAVIIPSPTFGDNCDSSIENNYNNTADASDTYPVGTTTVIWTVTDASNNTSTCSQDVTITDDELPSITCAADQTQTADTGICTTHVTVVGPTTGDNCGVDFVVNDYNDTADATDTYPVGTTTVIWTVTDVNGNTNTCEQDITITDNENPTYDLCPSDITVNTISGGCFASVTWTNPTVNDNCGVESLEYTSDDTDIYNYGTLSNGLFPVGSTVVTMILTDENGNEVTCTFTVTVVDNQDPIISNCPSDMTVNNNQGECGADVFYGIITASDNCSGVVLDPVSGHMVDGDYFSVGTTTVLFVATDAVGNTTECTFDVTVIDNEDPVITCPDDVTVSTDVGSCEATGVSLGTATVTDNCATITPTNDAPTSYVLGANTVTWTADDGNGNVVTCTQTVTVEDNEDPVITCPDDVTVSTDTGSCEATGVSLGTATVTDNCATITPTNGAPASYVLGANTVTWTADDGNGNVVTCTQTVTVVDNEDPVALCNDITVNLDATLSASVTAADINGNSVDNCDNDLTLAIIEGQSSYDCNDVGNSYNVTLQVTDDAGLTSTCIASVTVTDTNSECCAAPNAVCDDITVSFDGNSSILLLPADIDGGSTADCGLQSMTVSPNEFFCADYVGSNVTVTVVNVVLTVEDINGETSTCNASVSIINDDDPPVFDCPGNISLFNDPGQCGAIFNFDVTATDACSNANIVQTEGLPSGSLFPVGVTTNTFEASDQDNNVSVCSFTVTVVDNEAPVASCQDITVELGSTGPGSVSDSDISGVINTYASVTAVGSDNVTVTSAAGFGVNDKVIIMQMNGADIDLSNTASFGNVTAINNAGNYEYARIASISGTTVNFISSLIRSYDASATVQIIRVPEYNNVTVVGTLTAADWNGSIGGVLAFDAQGTVTMNAGINMDGKGFRGGLRSGNYYNGCENFTNYFHPSPSIRAGDKGEGISDQGAAYKAGRGKYVNGGGGGGSVNSGGGGGANYGAGGQGGREWSGCNLPLGGLGGADLSAEIASNRLYLGGAGGGGQQNNSVSTNGADGGGIILISADQIEGNGNTISANGINASAASNDGAGGGGAGGTVLLNTNSVNTALTVSVAGGAGGNASGGHGPAGGGGGGLLWHSSASVPTNVTINANGGVRGLAGGAEYGTSNGIDGGILGNLELPGVTTISSATILLTDVDAGSTDNCDIASVELSQTEFGCDDLGVVDVVLTVTDINGLSSTCEAIVTVIELNAPIISCPADITMDTDIGECNAVVNFDVMATDDCDDTVDLVYSHNSGDVFSLGTTTVTVTATDDSNNESTCSFTITVEDNEDPVITCPDDITGVIATSAAGATVTYTTPVGTDNCTPTTTLTAGLASSATFPIGTTTNTFTVTDEAGNSTSCSFDVIVEGIPPVIVCPENITVNTETGLCSADVTYAATETTGIPASTITYSIDPGSTFGLGTTTVTATATNAVGSDDCTFTVTVEDNEDPVITCPDDVTVSTDTGTCEATGVGLGTATVTDNCATITPTNDAPASYVLGANTVTWTADDGNGNVVTCTQTVTVEDNEDPVITCPSDITVDTEPGLCEATVTITEPTVSDNCSVLSLGNGLSFDGVDDIAFIASSSVINTQNQTKRTAEVYFRVDDKNISSHKQVVWEEGGTVNGLNIYIYNGQLYMGLYSGSTGWNPIGSWVSTSAIQSGQWHNAVLVFDGNLPAGERLKGYLDGNLIGMTSTSGNTLHYHPGQNAVGGLYNHGVFHDGVDNSTFGHYFGGDIDEVRLWTIARTEAELQATNTVQLVGNEPGLVLYYTMDQGTACADNSGINFLDDMTSTGLNGTLQGFNLDGSTGCNSNWTTGAPVLNSEITLTNDYTGTASASSSYPEGSTTVTYTATDEAGNEVMCSFTVTVEDNEDPVITCPDDITVSTDAGTCEATGVSLGTATVTDNCATITPTNDAPVSYVLGANTVTWTADDGNGNVVTCTQTITVEDNEDPVITCPDDITVSTDAGSCEATGVSLGTATVTDNCATITPTNDAPASYVLGDNTVTWTADDGNGNVVTCTQTVTVEDNEAPTAICQDITVQLDALGNATITPNDIDNGSNDACGIQSLALDITDFDCDDVGGSPNNFALDLDGSNDYVDLGDIDEIDGASQITFETWVYPKTMYFGSMMMAENSCCGNRKALFFSGGGDVYFAVENGGNAWGLTSGAGVPTAEWSHVAAVYDGSLAYADRIKIYVNGVLQTTNPSGGIPTTTSTDGNPLRLGVQGGAFHGNNILDEVRVWNTARSQSEILASMNAALTGNEAGLQAYYNMEDGTGSSTIMDLTSNGYTGTLVNMDPANDYVTGVPAVSGSGGSNPVVLTVTDNNGNTSTCEANVTIEDNILPTIDLEASNETIECDGAGNTAALNAWLASNGGAAASDACGVEWTNDFTALSDECGAIGSATVTFTATDPSSNSASTTATFTIEDTTNPTIAEVAEDETVECDGDGNTADLDAWLAANGGAVASDVCSGVIWSNDFTGLSDECGATGSATVTFTATDDCDNSSSTTATFTIEDTTNPTIAEVAEDETVECDGAGNTAELDAWLAANGGAFASDVCSGVTWSNDFTGLSDECGATGSATVTFTATDDCDNSSSTTATFTIEDTTNPTIAEVAEDETVECDGAGNTAELDVWLAANGGAIASDVCSGVIWSNDFTGLSDECGATGSATVTFTATDDCDNSSSTTATFTIEDTTNPTIAEVAEDETVECDGAGNTAELDAWLAANGGAFASDVCSGVTWSNDFTGLSDECGATGSATVTFTATDDCNNSSSTTATFTIEDITNPTIAEVAEDETVECDGDGNTAELDAWLAANGGAFASDVCSGVIWSNDFVALSDECGATGSATVTFTATDDCNNSSSTTATFTIEDTTNPTIAEVAEDETVECDGAGNTAELDAWLAANGGAIASDVCSGVSWSNDFTGLSDECGATGSATVTFTATDDCNNSSSTTATFTIEDTTNPTIAEVAEDETVECDGAGNTAELDAWLAANGGAIASDVCSGVSWSNDFTGLSDECGATGSATVTFTATDDCNNSSSTTATFTIEDITNPTIAEVAEDETVECDGDGNTAELDAWLAANGGAFASDVCSGVIWSNDFVALSDECGATGSATVTFTATDDCNNSSSTTATFTIEDTTNPTIAEVAEDETVECDGAGNTAELDAWLAANGGAIASDICSGVSWSNDFTGLSDECGATGSATVTFTATDDCNNSSSTTATFTIEDTTNPTIAEVAEDETVECDGAGNTAELDAWLAANGGAIASDVCSGVSWSNDFTGLSDECGATGSATVTFTATDDCNNSSSTTATFTIEDITNPTIAEVAEDETVECDGAGNTAELDAWLAANGGAFASDVCSGVIWSNDFVALSDECGATGSATVTFTATDDCNNSSSTTATFTIEDTTNPTIAEVAEDETVECDGAGNTAELDAWLAANGGAFASDVCSGVIWSNDFVALSDECGATGSATVTFTATDDCNNSSSTTATFTIEDTIPPAITCPDDIAICADQVLVTGSIVSWAPPVPLDICSSVNLVCTHEPGDTFPVGITTVTYTATDECGLETECSFEIEVYELPEVNITESELPIFCQNNVVILTANVVSNTGGITYDWSIGNTTDTVEVSASGIYEVTVTDANGCERSTSYDVTVDTTGLLSAYTILGIDEVHLHDNNVVVNGGVGVLDDDGKAKIQQNTMITGSTTFVIADDIDVKSGSVVTKQFAGTPNVTLPEFLYNPFTSDNDVTVNSGDTLILTDQVYGKLDIKEGATVIFTQQDIFIEDLKTKDDATIQFSGCTFMRIEKNLNLDDDILFNPDGYSVNVYVDANVEVKEGAEVRANIYANDHNINVNGKEDNQTYMYGRFIGKKIDGHQYVNWDWSTACDPTCEPGDPPVIYSCDCEDGMVSMSLVYDGPAGATVEAWYYGNTSLGTFYDVQPGDTLLVDATSIGEEKLKSTTSFYVNDGSEIEFHTSCSDDILNDTINELTVVGWVDGYNQTCGEGGTGIIPELPCNCEDGMVSLSLIYNGPAGATVEAWYYGNTSLGTFYDVQPGDTLLVDATTIGEVKLKSNTSFYVDGGSEIEFHTSCSDDILNETIDELTVVGWVDGDAGVCSDGGTGDYPELPIDCACEGGMVTLSLEYNGPAGVTIEAWYYGNTSLGTFNDVQPGDIIMVDATSIGEEKLKSKTSFYVDGGSEIEFHTSCSQDIYDETIDELTVTGWEDKYGNVCPPEDSYDNDNGNDEVLHVLHPEVTDLELNPNLTTREVNIPFDLESKIDVFPNPAYGRVNISVTSPDKDIELLFLDRLGRKVWTKTISKEGESSLISVDLDTFNSGIYIIHAILDGKLHTKRLIIIE